MTCGKLPGKSDDAPEAKHRKDRHGIDGWYSSDVMITLSM